MSKLKQKEELASVGTSSLNEQFTEVKEAASQFRTVELKYSSCCGCGCHTINFKREVPVKSKLRDGDFVDDMEDDDKRI